MTPSERKNLQKLDDLVLNASVEELKKIQEVDHQNQMEGLSLYEVYLDSSSLINQSIKKPSRKS
ncbi:hypothetical protein AAA799E16_00624 [Marine Group I thaumarchaeote SCGC AAA799-E16]|uniref:Uncharacterized protein n=4 Tax=Marine Group I TaxID=905826 RepID=A0A081RPE2_9ARCH|nr:hypothetical protein AAA799N04_00463 [Marine Group I thaumarchaeote SCGC AAA799-N04]KER06565.1 hypothetical protein AAA799E16_00624 [Marine Group I thaumarchaeote SCGC AAA799-E16]KFM16121.1 hypothetical protein AAA799D11_00920 [Marine Group I thaumarchaeote SCGC AAA799-D11]KFM17858.1 hypothetical protein SCCGRSA3_01798 [Marine Group I thaumarchaeote SCGC RSA3]